MFKLIIALFLNTQIKECYITNNNTQPTCYTITAREYVKEYTINTLTDNI